MKKNYFNTLAPKYIALNRITNTITLAEKKMR